MIVKRNVVVLFFTRLEKVNVKSVYSKVKIVGTLMCVVGAFAMSLMQSSSSATWKIEEKKEANEMMMGLVLDEERMVGCLYLLGAVMVLSSNVVLQASTLGEFPAPMSLGAITSLIGVLITAVVQIALHNENPQLIITPLISLPHLIAFSLLGGTVSGVCVSFNGWAMKKRGPVLVSMFSPISTVVSALLSFLTFGDIINLGSFGGMLLMFTGLYLVLWAKGKEDFSEVDSFESEFDAEKPLLS